jgi:hypothetical protein
MRIMAAVAPTDTRKAPSVSRVIAMARTVGLKRRSEGRYVAEAMPPGGFGP